jgi:hypothetical protein
MRTKILLAIIGAVVIFSCSKSTEPKFLFLNAEQLKPLGIEINERGVFYKNVNPDWQRDKERFAGLAFASSEGNYLSTMHFNENEILKPTNLIDSLYLLKEISRNDFYPLLIGNNRGENSLDNETLPADMKLLPAAICMADTKIQSRNDTLVVWFKPTESLQKALPDTIKMNDYLSVRLKKI